MRSSGINSLAVSAVLGFFAAPASAFIRFGCGAGLVEERADPIINPGQVSGHVHHIVGGNGFGFSESYAQARASECSSCPIKADLSNYWTPKLYYHAKNGSFIDVPAAGTGGGNLGGMTVYYQQRGTNRNIKAFPPGFRMVAGNPFLRSYGGDKDFTAKAISYACLDYNGPGKAETHGFPNTNCPNGLRAQVYFPSCWDGVNLDSADHKSHMSYPDPTKPGDYNGGTCPDSHPVQLVSIFFETIWQTNLFANNWYGNSQPFVWAMGDPTGYGYHGDFVNGWDVSALQAIINDCTDDSGNLSDCPHTQDSALFTNGQQKSCRQPSLLADEVIDGVLDALPGCNPVTNGPAAAKPVTNCAVAASIGKPAQSYTDVTESLGWEYVGCASDASSRTLTGTSNVYGGVNFKNTVENCITYCKGKGYQYAGMEYSSQCFCGNSVASDRAPKAGILGDCVMPCTGDSSQICGGPNALSLYKNCNGGSCVNADDSVSKRAVDVDASSLHLSSRRLHARHLAFDS